jgi:hypothetical protein
VRQRIDGYQRSQEMAVILVKAEDRGNLGGEFCRGEVHWNSENSSPKS